MKAPELNSLPRALVQRLESWMQEITSLLAYQPDIPLEHKTTMIKAMHAFENEVKALDERRQHKESTMSKKRVGENCLAAPIDTTHPNANMYGCQPCPNCKSLYRYPDQKHQVLCDECGLVQNIDPS